MKKAVVLLSGGVDSSVTLYLARQRGFDTTALVFDYRQRHRKEIDAARRIAKRAGCACRVVRLPFTWKGSSLLDAAVPVPSGRKGQKRGIPSTYVPARNLVFLSVATSLAESIGAEAIFIGAHTQDFSGYPDCRKAFFASFRKTVRTGTKNGRRIRILTPLIGKKKRDIVTTGLRLGVPLALTWSCYRGGAKPCGTCDSCFFRQKAFKELRLTDPAT
jgi:7-cyano-7-deazaguanine synthase